MLNDTLDPTRDRWFLGTLLRVIAGADDTDGGLTVMEQLAPKNFSPPLHVHRLEDTALLVLDGRVTVRRGDEEWQLGAGEMAWLPRDVPHCFRVDSDVAHLLELATPAGIEGFHLDASDPAPRLEMPPPGPPDVERMLSAASRYQAELVGPPLTTSVPA